MKGHSAGKLTLVIGLTFAFGPMAFAQQSPANAAVQKGLNKYLGGDK